MTDRPTLPPAPQRLRIVKTDTHRLLRNASEVDATFVALVSKASYWHMPGEDDVTTSSAPCVAVRDLPAGHDVVLETVDPYEESRLTFTLIRAEWADGRLDVGLAGDPPRNIPLADEIETGERSWLTVVSEALLAGQPMPDRPSPPPRVERELYRLGTVPGHVSHGLLNPEQSPPEASERATRTCLTCTHAVRAVALGCGVRCTHPAHNPHGREDQADLWTVPGRWYRCPLYEPQLDSSRQPSHA